MDGMMMMMMMMMINDDDDGDDGNGDVSVWLQTTNGYIICINVCVIHE